MGDSARPFLEGVILRKVPVPGDGGFKPVGLALGNGISALEVLVASYNATPPLWLKPKRESPWGWEQTWPWRAPE